jgi:16S rRNA (cytidine1402-2'-O)-methyltransferase
MSTLYMVATPIGNMEDISYRAVRILKEVETIACEDTRQSIKLLNHYDIKAHLISCRAANEKQSSPGIVKLLQQGQSVAYVSDAGTPGLSDPGKILVRHVRDAGFPVVPLPGASALTALISVCGFPSKAVTFEGFLPPKGNKLFKRLKELLENGPAFVLYESPYRFLRLLEEIKELDNMRQILVGREISKKFEEFMEGSADEVFANCQNSNTIKGEFALLVSGSGKAKKKG